MSEVYHDSHSSVIQLPLFVFSQVCTHCYTEKPIEDFFKNAKSPTGYQVCCKDCMHMLYSKTKDPRKRRSQLVILPTKICTQCKQEKVLEDFYVKNEHRDGHDSQCKVCRSEYTKQRRLNDPEWRRAQDRKKRTLSLRQLETMRKRYRHCVTNTIWASQECRRKSIWKREHPLQCYEYARRRSARKRHGQIEKVSYEQILARDGYICHICHERVASNELSFDHVIPLARGGAHAKWNIKVAHLICNSRKGARLMEELTDFHRRGIG